MCGLALALGSLFSGRAELAPLHVVGADLVANGQGLRLRGINWGWWHLSGTRYGEGDMRAQADWGANVARLAFSYGDLEDQAHPGQWREDGFQQFDEVIQWAQRHQQYVILDLHVAAGGQDTAPYCDGGANRIWADAGCQQRFIALWCEIARRYRHRSEVAAYELLNEPCTCCPTPDRLVALCRRAVVAIRTVDPDKVIVMSGDQWSNARELKDAIKLPDTNILYTFHFYEGGPVAQWLSNASEGQGLAGTHDWTRVERSINVPAGASLLSIMLRSSKNSGTAWFDDVVLTDENGKVVHAQGFDGGPASYRGERPPATVVAHDAAVGHEKPGSLRVSGTTDYNGWSGPRLPVQSGRTYHLSGWVKLENATGATYLSAAFFGLKQTRVDPEDLRRHMAPAVAFARKFTVPVWVGEFSCERDRGPPGLQANSVAARIALFEEYGFHWTYWNYRETSGPGGMALQAQKKSGEDYPVNEALLGVLRAGWKLNAPAAK